MACPIAFASAASGSPAALSHGIAWLPFTQMVALFVVIVNKIM
jgi:hypothetical protein